MQSRNMATSVFSNVVPAALLGAAVVKFCERFVWKKSVGFLAAHLSAAFVFAFSWCFLTLFFLSVASYVQSGVWQFVVWGIYALQWQFFSGLMAYFTIASAVYVGKFNENLQFEERRNAELEILKAQAETARRNAELFALRSQLNPHFLFNTLHSVMALVRTDAVQAEAAIESFSRMLRYVLRSQADESTRNLEVNFGEELAFIEDYLELEKIRLGKRLRIKKDISAETLSCRLPAFAVQPLVENAIKHAVSPRASGGEILLKSRAERGFLNIVVKDDGEGAETGKIAETKGFGLRLIRQTLLTKYGENAVLEVATAPHKGFTATLKIPEER